MKQHWLTIRWKEKEERLTLREVVDAAGRPLFAEYMMAEMAFHGADFADHRSVFVAGQKLTPYLAKLPYEGYEAKTITRFEWTMEQSELFHIFRRGISKRASIRDVFLCFWMSAGIKIDGMWSKEIEKHGKELIPYIHAMRLAEIDHEAG